MIFLPWKRHIDISNVILNNIDSQNKQDIFTGKYKDEWLTKLKNGR